MNMEVNWRIVGSLVAHVPVSFCPEEQPPISSKLTTCKLISPLPLRTPLWWPWLRPQQTRFTNKRRGRVHTELTILHLPLRTRQSFSPPVYEVNTQSTQSLQFFELCISLNHRNQSLKMPVLAEYRQQAHGSGRKSGEWSIGSKGSIYIYLQFP